MVSVLCSIYDPLGFIAPCILESKFIAQECWKRNLDWDDPLPCDLLSRFKKWQKKLYLIKDIKVPRFYGFNEVKGDTIELHIFTDSSQVLYGTCAYFCIIQGNDIKISFIIGKSCLVPLNSKVLTIPKLELQTAVIASRMKGKIVDDLELVGDLSTDSFILALKRLIARRGQPKVMYSDNGSNFRGAEKELGDLFSKIDFDKVSKTLTNDNINRKFIPPLS